MDNLEKVGINLSLKDLKPIKTNKQLALENLEDIVKMMWSKVNDSETHGINDFGKDYIRHYAEIVESEIRRYKT